MDNKIAWETDLSVTVTKAAEQNKPIFLDFFNPG